MKHPIQPLEADEHGVTRFKENKIVRYLLDAGPFDLNTLAMQDYSQEDKEQFAQLIGYSHSCFGDLSYVGDEVYEAAEKMFDGKQELEARNEYLRGKLAAVKKATGVFTTAIFNIHPDDLEGL